MRVKIIDQNALDQFVGQFMRVSDPSEPPVFAQRNGK
jgi:hypothetical protein